MTRPLNIVRSVDSFAQYSKSATFMVQLRKDGVLMRSEQELAITCPECGPLPQPALPKGGFPMLKDPLELVEFGFSKRVETAHSHAIPENGVLAEYKFVGRLSCSLPDHTSHNHGYLVRTRCGLLLTIGKDCGHNHIKGLKAAVAKATNERVRREVAESLKTRPTEMRTAIAERRTRFGDAFERLASIKAWTPELHELIHTHQAYSNLRRAKFTEEWLLSHVRELEVLEREEVTLENAGNLLVRLIQGDHVQEDLLKGLQEMESLFSKAGMDLAIQRCRKEGAWSSRENGELEFRHAGRQHRLSLSDGLS